MMGRSVQLLIYVALIHTLPDASSQVRTSNACFSSGGMCGFHTLACEQSLTISILTMDYGFIGTADYVLKGCESVMVDCGILGSRPSCCEYDANTDCLKTYSSALGQQVRSSCQGSTTCTFQATRVAGGCNNPPFTYSDVSSFSRITYFCGNGTGSQPPANQITPRGPDGQPPANQITPCPGCTADSLETTRELNATQTERDESLLQLIVGVSVGVGSGIMSLIIIAVVCWLRMRNKPPSPGGYVRSGYPATTTRSSTRMSNAHTTSSSVPSSVYSSFFNSDTIPSSHPESVYNVPVDAASPSNVDWYSQEQNYGFGTSERLAARNNYLPDDFNTPPSLPARPGMLMSSASPTRDRRAETNGVFSFPPNMPSEGRPEVGSLRSVLPPVSGGFSPKAPNTPQNRGERNHFVYGDPVSSYPHMRSYNYGQVERRTDASLSPKNRPFTDYSSAARVPNGNTFNAASSASPDRGWRDQAAVGNDYFREDRTSGPSSSPEYSVPYEPSRRENRARSRSPTRPQYSYRAGDVHGYSAAGFQDPEAGDSYRRPIQGRPPTFERTSDVVENGADGSRSRNYRASRNYYDGVEQML